MKIPFRLPFFKIKQEKISNKNIIPEDIVIEDKDLDEKDILLRNLDKDKLETLFFRTGLNKDSIDLVFVKKLNSTPTLLSYLADNIFDGGLIRKINDNALRIEDVENYYYKELFNYDIFIETDNEILDIFRSKIELSDKGYAYFDINDFENNDNTNSYIDNYIDSFIEGEKILISRKKAFPLKENVDDNVNIIFPLEKDNIFIKNIFNYYYSGDLEFSKDCILFISYDMLLEWIKDDQKRNILKQVQVVITDDYNYIQNVYSKINWAKDKYMIDIFKDDNKINKSKAKINHLLFLINNSELNDSDKQYYNYYVTKKFNVYCHSNGYYLDRELEQFINEIKDLIDSNKRQVLNSEFNKLDINEKNKDIEQVKFSAEIFLKNFDNLEEISSFNFLNYIFRLNSEEKRIVLNDDRIINKLRGLLKECAKDEYYYYDMICKTLNTSDIFKIFDAKFIKNFYNNNRQQNEYRFFYTILKHDINGALKFLVADDDYFKEFIKNIDNYNFEKIDYSILVSLLKKIDNSNLNMSNNNWCFLISINNKLQEQLLTEDFSDDFLVKMITYFNKDIQQSFYLNDKRFNYLWDKFNILGLSRANYNFSKDVVNKNEFFDKFKSTSMVDFRINVNRFLIHQADLAFEEKINKYEDGLISSFNEDEELFTHYKELLNNIELLDDRIFISKGINFFYDSNTNADCRKYVARDVNGKIYIKDKDGLINYLKWSSKVKLNEVIIDRLFKDNIYNVFLNIKEMIRFNKELLPEERVLNQEQVSFYEMILNIDKLDTNTILDIYNKFKDKNIALMFYEDIQKLKNTSYDKIKKDLFQPENMVGLEDKELSEKYGVKVFDLRDKNFVILSRCLPRIHYSSTHTRRECYTLLSNENSNVFDDNSYIYGFSGFDNDCILHIFEGDSGSGDVKLDELSAGSDLVNRIMTSKEIATNSCWYSEVQIVNKKINESNCLFESLRPSFMIVFNEINDKTLEEAKRKNLPICIISHNIDKELEGKIDFNHKIDVYTKEYGMSNEHERRKSR